MRHEPRNLAVPQHRLAHAAKDHLKKRTTAVDAADHEVAPDLLDRGHEVAINVFMRLGNVPMIRRHGVAAKMAGDGAKPVLVDLVANAENRYASGAPEERKRGMHGAIGRREIFPGDKDI